MWPAYASVNALPHRARLAIAIVGLRSIIPWVRMSVEPLAVVDGTEDPGAGTGNSPRLTFSSAFSSSSTRASAASVRGRSALAFNLLTWSYFTAIDALVDGRHSCSIFSTTTSDCASRASAIPMTRRNPAISMVYVVSCSAARPLKPCTQARDCDSCWDWELWTLQRALSDPSVET